VKDYERILIATDFSPNSEAAAQRGVDLAWHSGARILMLHVIQHFPEDLPVEPIAPEDADTSELLLNRAHEALANLAKRVGCEEAEQKVIVSVHASKNEIVQFANDQKVDLIVVGAHSRPGIADLLGTTASAVVNHARCDVLVVHAG
jgi:universal stress protein A